MLRIEPNVLIVHAMGLVIEVAKETREWNEELLMTSDSLNTAFSKQQYFHRQRQ